MSTTPAPQFAEADFRKATRSDPDKACVRVARYEGWVEIRDDKTSFGAANDHRLRVTSEDFEQFLAGVRSGDTTKTCLTMTERTDGLFTLTTSRTDGDELELVFTRTEVLAFLDGITRGEFDHDTTATVAFA